MRKTLIVIVLLSLAACSPGTTGPKIDPSAVNAEREFQNELVVSSYVDDWTKYWRAALPISYANVAACQAVGKTVVSSGIKVRTIYTWPEALRTAAARATGIGDQPRISDIVVGTPAAEAGLMIGDALLEYGGEKISGGKDAVTQIDKAIASAAMRGGVTPIVVERQGRRLTAEVKHTATCNYQFALSESQAINAYTDGETIYVTRGMMRFATDDELAVVIGHEMAHNLRRHVEGRAARGAAGSVLDMVAAALGIPTSGAFRNIAANFNSKDFEREADYIGLYLMANAGFDVGAAPVFWRKMAVAHPGSVKSGYLSTHPSTAERFVALEAIVAEIKSLKNKSDAVAAQVMPASK